MLKHARLGLACSILDAGRLFFSIIAALMLCYPVGLILYDLGMSEAISGIAAFIVVFILALLLSKLFVKLLSKIKIPIVTKVDKFLGAILGCILGILFVSILSTTVYTILEMISLLSNDAEIMNVYDNSHIFKYIYDLKIFEFIRNLF